MNPSNKPYEHSPEMPRTDSENGGLSGVNNDKAKVLSEKSSQISELPGTHIPLPVSISQSDSAAPSTPPPIPSDNNAANSSSVSGISLPAAAMDDDLIEAEWVNRARVIVDRNREDPHNQNKEMNKVKADYIKKRYNKDIKVEEE